VTPHSYREALPRTYGALVAHHGSPNPVQLEAAAPLLDGRDVFIGSATASGKTIAYTAPLAELHCRGGDEPARVVVVSPTRALVNDLARRLGERLAGVGIEVGRWTGDHHDGGRLHGITVMTPEGLDSRLSRAPADLAGVRALVLDELHVLDGTARGDHLRILVQRLRVERRPPRGSHPGDGPPPLQVVAASATVPDPTRMAGRYLRDPEIVTAGDRRAVRARIVHGRDVATIRDTLGELARAGARKVLVFCNARSEVEHLAHELAGRPPFGHAVFAHHGSLARTARLQTERRFGRAPTAVCFATSTLELGIDIGDVDLVALTAVPPDVASLLQRTGRGGRRTTVNHVVCFAASPFERSVYRTLLTSQKQGRWLEGPVTFRPGVLVQQAVSIVQSRPSRTVDGGAVRRRLPPDLAREWPVARLDRVLAQVGEAGWLERVATREGLGVYRLGERGEQGWHRGQLHANIPERFELQVTDALTGDEVGRVGRPGRELALGGKGRQQLRREGRRVVTRASNEPASARFRAGPPAATPPSMARALLEGAGIPVPCRVKQGRTEVLFHGLGTAGGPVLAEALRQAGAFRTGTCSLLSAGRLALVVEGELPPDRWPDREATAEALAAIHDELAGRLQMGPHHANLPPDERRQAVEEVAEVDVVQELLARGLPEQRADAPEGLSLEAAGW
jgi:ATP-dependent helicase Lhr and Lhr-like helicase